MPRFMYVLIRILLLLSPCIAAPTLANQQIFRDTADLIAYARPAVVFIKHQDDSGKVYTGTGFIVQKKGIIVTCAHIVRPEQSKKPACKDKVWVRLYDGQVHDATCIRYDAENDIAVLSIDRRGCPFLALDVSVPQPGDGVIVFGFPLGDVLGKEPSVTQGIISAVRFSNQAYQLDAAVNPGNSGGPVLNRNGAVLGALSFKVRAAEGMCFAVASSLFAKDAAKISQTTQKESEPITGQAPTADYFFTVVAQGNLEEVRKLLDEGADPNQRDNRNLTPLFYASKPDIAEVLLKYGADANARDNNNCTLLFYSIKADVAEVLLKYGADVNARDKNGLSPLFYSIRPDVAELLIKGGAKITARDRSGDAPIHYAARAGNSELIRILVKNGADVNIKNGADEKSPLHHATFTDKINVVKALLGYGADVNARDKALWTPLHFARTPEIAEELLKQGADVNAKTMSRATPLDTSTMAGNYEVADVIRKYGGR